MTKEKAIELLKEIIDEGWLISDFEKCPAIDACEMAIKALEQEFVLDKIKEEIKDNTYFINETTEKEGIDFETVEKIIDKYKAESEDNK